MNAEQLQEHEDRGYKMAMSWLELCALTPKL